VDFDSGSIPVEGRTRKLLNERRASLLGVAKSASNLSVTGCYTVGVAVGLRAANSAVYKLPTASLDTAGVNCLFVGERRKQRS